MFFRKFTLDRGPAKPTPAVGPDVARPLGATPPAPQLTAIPGGQAGAPDVPVPSRARPTPAHGLSLRTSGGQVDEVGLVLDTLGSILTSLARHTFDLPDRSAAQIGAELQRWQRHATLGVPVHEASGSSLGVRERDWDGVARTFTEHRREEARYVDSTMGELRDALWAVVEAVHTAVRVEQQADRTTDLQVHRARTAIARLQTGHIKQEVLGALSAIEEAFRARQEQLQAQYQALAGRIEKLGSQLEEAKRESTTDALTGLGNRKLFDAMAHRAVHLHALSRQPVALLMVDLDKFKLVNDLYGHQAGDQTLVGVAKCLSRVFLRQSDVVCRYGGDEYAIVLNNTDVKVAHMLARRLLETVAAMPSPHPHMEFAVGASVGIAAYDGEENVESWIARADRALYTAKQSGSERIAVAGATLAVS
jgi:diguanylate cyclase (GGDEF)-like protein